MGTLARRTVRRAQSFQPFPSPDFSSRSAIVGTSVVTPLRFLFAAAVTDSGKLSLWPIGTAELVTVGVFALRGLRDGQTKIVSPLADSQIVMVAGAGR